MRVWIDAPDLLGCYCLQPVFIVQCWVCFVGTVIQQSCLLAGRLVCGLSGFLCLWKTKDAAGGMDMCDACLLLVALLLACAASPSVQCLLRRCKADKRLPGTTYSICTATAGRSSCCKAVHPSGPRRGQAHFDDRAAHGTMEAERCSFDSTRRR